MLAVKVVLSKGIPGKSPKSGNPLGKLPSFQAHSPKAVLSMPRRTKEWKMHHWTRHHHTYRRRKGHASSPPNPKEGHGGTEMLRNSTKPQSKLGLFTSKYMRLLWTWWWGQVFPKVNTLSFCNQIIKWIVMKQNTFPHGNSARYSAWDPDQWLGIQYVINMTSPAS